MQIEGKDNEWVKNQMGSERIWLHYKLNLVVNIKYILRLQISNFVTNYYYPSFNLPSIPISKLENIKSER